MERNLEASAGPDRALASADRLTELVPGSGHLVHMPSHIYGWSLTGLKPALGKQDRPEEAAELADRLDRSFHTADIRPTSSCYCEP